ncbi:alkaline phosphatase family protein [Streptomyces sp. NPDC090442]|uniref:alkaline phosphatase family protein n=1 Tax=Streptomyces sp. NPDC090442 TaxID=3365962 RepID=UPI00381ECDB2
MSTSHTSHTNPAPRVLVVGIDGVRYDLLDELPTPHLDSVADAGFLAPIEIDAATPTMSGPCWATIATGVTPTKHGIWGNNLTGNRLEVFPDFATRLTQLDGRRTFVAGGWAPLMIQQDGGALFRAPSRLSFIGPTDHTPKAWDDCDAQVTTEAVHVLDTSDPEVSFVYLGAVDETAHFLGCGAEYREAVVRADERLGLLLTAIRNRPNHANEAWTVIVVTDHGHVDAGGHGGNSAEERTAWVAYADPAFPQGQQPSTPIHHPDIAAQVYASLGRPIDPHWTLDGRPFANTRA